MSLRRALIGQRSLEIQCSCKESRGASFENVKIDKVPIQENGENHPDDNAIAKPSRGKK